MTRLLPFLVFGLGLGLTACDGDDAIDLAQPRLEVRLTDAPGPYDAVLIDVRDFVVKTDGADDLRLDAFSPGTYDLLELTNGIDTLLGTSTLPPGTLREVRLLLGDGNFVVIDGDTLPMRTPSAQQSGLKIKFAEPVELVPGGVYVLTLDFDAARSVVCAGNSGNINLKPVIRASVRLVDVARSAITGFVAPAEEQYVRAVSASLDTIGTFSDATGMFRLVDVPAGVYELTVEAPEGATYEDLVLPGVRVEEGGVTDVGRLEL